MAQQIYRLDGLGSFARLNSETANALLDSGIKFFPTNEIEPMFTQEVTDLEQAFSPVSVTKKLEPVNVLRPERPADQPVTKKVVKTTGPIPRSKNSVSTFQTTNVKGGDPSKRDAEIDQIQTFGPAANERTNNITSNKTPGQKKAGVGKVAALAIGLLVVGGIIAAGNESPKNPGRKSKKSSSLSGTSRKPSRRTVNNNSKTQKRKRSKVISVSI